MDFDASEENNFLLELYEATQSDTGVQTSMYEVGASIGLEKDAAGTMAENLIVQGWVELVSLSGGISITDKGIEKLQLAGGVSGASGPALQLGPGPVFNDTGREAVEKIVAEIKTGIGPIDASYTLLEEIVIDIKTIEVHMLSPKSKVEVVRELLRSLQETLATLKADALAAKLKAIISS